MKTGRKISGGRYKKARKKKAYEATSQEKSTKLGNERRKSKKTKGGNKKIILFQGKKINVLFAKTKKTKKLEIKNVIETPSNRFLARQNIITKGTIVETTTGEKVKVTNRPSQEGHINGTLVD